jgi:CRP/FNR family cyclic AMP-dependent transcriptional regulator
VEWPLLATLDANERRELLGSTQLRRFSRGEVVVREGDPSDSMHLIQSGRLAVRVTTAQGDNATVNVLGPGDFFGELSLLGGDVPTRSSSVVALEVVETRSLSAQTFRQLRARHGGVDQLLLRLLAARIEELTRRLVETMYDGLDRRVCQRLIELAGTYSDGSADPVVIPLTQDALSEVVGGKRPSVNQVLQRLAARGAVQLARGRITIRDRASLARWAD